MRKNNIPLHTDRNTRQIWSKLGDLEKKIKVTSNYTNLLKSSVVNTINEQSSSLDGGFAASVYLNEEVFDGGGA